jgi:hypothetical protein
MTEIEMALKEARKSLGEHFSDETLKAFVKFSRLQTKHMLEMLKLLKTITTDEEATRENQVKLVISVIVMNICTMLEYVPDEALPIILDEVAVSAGIKSAQDEENPHYIG